MRRVKSDGVGSLLQCDICKKVVYCANVYGDTICECECEHPSTPCRWCGFTHGKRDETFGHDYEPERRKADSRGRSSGR